MTVQVEIDEDIVSKVDSITSDRIGFIRRTIVKELWRKERRSSSDEIDKEIIESYTRQPQLPDEYEPWQDEQVWED